MSKLTSPSPSPKRASKLTKIKHDQSRFSKLLRESKRKPVKAGDSALMKLLASLGSSISPIPFPTSKSHGKKRGFFLPENNTNMHQAQFVNSFNFNEDQRSIEACYQLAYQIEYVRSKSADKSGILNCFSVELQTVPEETEASFRKFLIAYETAFGVRSDSQHNTLGVYPSFVIHITVFPNQAYKEDGDTGENFVVRSYASIVVLGEADHVAYFNKVRKDFFKSVEDCQSPDVLTLTEFVRDKDGDIAQMRNTYTISNLPKVLPEFYPYLEAQKLSKLFFTSNENILFLLGEPGTGKTSMVKLILQEVSKYLQQSHKHGNVRAAYVKDPSVLKDYLFWSRISDTDKDFHFLILDDLDKELSPRNVANNNRGENNNDIVSSMLSFTNGVFPNTTKLIITSNILDEEIDSALVRPGRCFDILKLRALTKVEAISVWMDTLKMSDESFARSFEGATTISQAELMSTYEHEKTRDNEYLLDKSVSVRSNYTRNGKPRRIGF